jgi:hypothetical protein
MANPQDLAEVREMFARHKHALIERYGAHGAGVGRSNDGTRYEIVVYLDRGAPEPAGSQTLEGVALRFEHRDRARPL